MATGFQGLYSSGVGRVRHCLLIGMLLGLAVPAAQAQTIRIDLDRAPLREALLDFGARHSVDVVFSERQVASQQTSCRYAGRRLDDAFACLLRGTGLRAERVRRRQYVLAALPPAPDASAPPELPRGALAGFVADAETQEVLSGAHVYLPDLGLGTATNEAGYFVLPALPVQPYRLRISHLGYQTLDTALVAGAERGMLRLQAAALSAGEVTVEASRERPALEPGVVAVPVQQLDQLPTFPGEPDLFQALQWLPGVHRAGEVGGGLIIRGGQPDQNLYLLDGAPVYHPWHAFSLVSTFQTETFKDVRLYQGLFPAEHGGRLAAVLDAEMKDGARDDPRVLAAVGMLSGRFIVESPLSRSVSFMVSGRRSYLDQLIGTEHPVSEGTRRDTLRTGYFFYDTSAKLTLRPGLRHRVSVSYYRGRDVLDVRLPFDLSLDFAEWLRPADLFFEVDQHWGNRLVSTRYQFLYSRRFFVTATAYRSSYSAREATLIRPTAASIVASDYQVRLRDLGVKLDVDYYPALAHQVRAGVQVIQRGFRSDLAARIQRSPGAVDSLDQESHSEAFEVVAYVQDAWQVAPRWQLQPGLRASLFGEDRLLRLSPRLAVRYAAVPERLVVRAGGGVQVQYLHRVRDRYAYLYDLVSSRWLPAGAGAPPATSLHGSAGAEAYPARGLTLALDGYWRSTDGVLLPRDVFQTKDGLAGPGIEVATLLGQYTPGEGRAYGAEVFVRYERGPWQVWASYAGARALTRADAGLGRRFRPYDFDVPRAVRGAFSRRTRHWHASLSADWRSGFPVTVPESRYALGDPLDDAPIRYLYRPEVNNGRLPPYFRLDLLAGYRFRVAGVQAQAQLNLYNLTNRRNVIDRLYDPDSEGGVEVRDRRGLPLLPLLELRVEL